MTHPSLWRCKQKERPIEIGSTLGCYVVLREASSMGSGLRYWVRCPHGREYVKRAHDLRKAPSSCRACARAEET